MIFKAEKIPQRAKLNALFGIYKQSNKKHFYDLYKALVTEGP